MNVQTRHQLTVLLSGIVFGLAGLWVASDKVKGVLIGSAAGGIGAGGFVYQDKRLRELARQQKRLLTDGAPHNQRDSNELRQLYTLSSEHQNKLAAIENDLSSSVAQVKLYGKDINRIRLQLNDLSSRINQDSQNDNGGDPDRVERIEEKLQALENRADAILSGLSNSPVETEAIATAEQPSESDGVNGEVEAAIQWLNLNQTEVESSYEPDPKIDDLLDGLSRYLGENYALLSGFHWKLRNNVGRKLYFNLANHNPREKSIHNQYIRLLRSSDFLRFGRIIKSGDKPDYIIATSYDRSDIQGFFHGGWFERFIYTKIVELLDAEDIQYEVLRNLKVAYASGEEAEFDLFFLINGKPLLIECKAGQNYDITRFVQHRERLDLDIDSAIFVVLDIGDSEAHLRTKNWNITVVNQTSLIEHIETTVLADELDEDNRQEGSNEGAEDSEETTDKEGQRSDDLLESAYNSGLLTFFRQKTLNLAPESRAVVFQKAIELIEQDGPISFNTMTKTLRDRMVDEPSSLSRRKICEILNCLRYSNVFQDDKNKPVRNVNVPIHGMASVDYQDLDRQCMEFYAQKVVQMFDPDFFEVGRNQEEFQRLTHGDVPSADKINRFKEQ